MHGPKISTEDYHKRIVSLYSRQYLSDQVRRKFELDLTIDHRLGINFPDNRRDQLWAIHQKIENERKWLFIKSIFNKLVGKKSLIPEINGIASYLVQEYSQVLSYDELVEFFGTCTELPIDQSLLTN